MNRKIPLVTFLSSVALSTILYFFGISDGYNDRVVAVSSLMLVVSFGGLLTVVWTNAFFLWWKVYIVLVPLAILGLLFADDVRDGGIGITMFKMLSAWLPIIFSVLSVILVVVHTLWIRMKKNKA